MLQTVLPRVHAYPVSKSRYALFCTYLTVGTFIRLTCETSPFFNNYKYFKLGLALVAFFHFRQKHMKNSAKASL